MREKVLSFGDNRVLRYLAWGFILLFIIDLTYSLGDTIARFQSGDWGELRSQIYEDIDSVELYANRWQKLVKNLLSYLRPFAFVYAFFQLTLSKRNGLFTILLFASLIIPSFMSATVLASRGMVFFVALDLVLGFLMFRDYIPAKRKRVLLFVAIFVAAFFIFYSIAVSISRFGQDEYGNSIFSYFGHSMLSFNDGLFNNLKSFAWGRRFFSWFIDLLGGNSNFDVAKAGSTHGSSFFTIVGGMFIDWGPIGTVIVALITCIIICHFTHKRALRLSDLIVVFFYLSTLSRGLFAFGRGRAIVWVMTFILYFIIKLSESNTKNQLRIN